MVGRDFNYLQPDALSSFVCLLMYDSANVSHFVPVVLNLLKWTLCPIACKVQALAPEDVETGAVGWI